MPSAQQSCYPATAQPGFAGTIHLGPRVLGPRALPPWYLGPWSTGPWCPGIPLLWVSRWGYDKNEVLIFCTQWAIGAQ